MNFDQTNGFVGTETKIRRRLKPTDPDFVAPDGGWGWLIVFACGLSNLSIYSMFQQFGLVFAKKFQQIGITHTQTTTIININLAFTSCLGLFNGPIYRKFSFRQVGLFGSSLVVSSLLIIIWCESFWSYLVFYGFLFGSSIGLTQSANALALNTYFKKKRSIAMGLSWGVSGIGPIVWPYVITVFMNYYGTNGTLLLFAGFAGHAIVCSFLLQPVHWHTKYRKTDVPLLLLHPKNKIERSKSLPVYGNILEKSTIDNPSFNYIHSSKSNTDDNTDSSQFIKNWIKNRYHKSELNFTEQASSTSDPLFKLSHEENCTTKPEPNILNNFIAFFDCDILKDLVYLNIIFGMISICFVEINFNILTPAILREFNFEEYEIATYMSILAVTDLIVRFCCPFVASKLKWNSRIFYLLGTLLTTTGRIVLIHIQHSSVLLFVAVLVGFGRGLCIVYLALLIPNHVSLQKLPAAMGIFLAFFGTFLILMAPVVGWIRDISHSYVTTIHFLHILIYIAALSWILEYYWRKCKIRVKIHECNGFS